MDEVTRLRKIINKLFDAVADAHTVIGEALIEGHGFGDDIPKLHERLWAVISDEEVKRIRKQSNQD